jgi:Tol biopolymer transport system component
MSTHKHLRKSLTGVSVALAVLLAGAGQSLAQFCFGEPENLGAVVNSSAHDAGPSISADGLTLFFASDRPGALGRRDLWMTTRASLSDPWETPVNLGPTVNTSYDDGGSCISADGLTLFFHSNRPFGVGWWDLWMTTRASLSDPWQTPVNLGPTVNSSYFDGGPDISADGLTLFFVSTRYGGFGGPDLWMTTRASLSDPWQAPVNLGPTVNTSYYDLDSSISADGLTLFFASDRPGGFAGDDLWMTTRASLSDPWQTPVNLGPTVNTSYDDGGSCISADGLTLFFSSDRPGGEGDFDLWQVTVSLGDLDGDGDIDLADLSQLLAAYRACVGDPDYDPAADIDHSGCVDLSDLATLLANYGCGT